MAAAIADTGFLSSPYHKVEEAGYDACYCGYAYREQPDLEELVEDVVKNGYQMSIHANGDQAINNTIDAYERALEVTKKSGTDHRLVIQHCQTPREDQLERMGKLGIAASFFANHVWCATPPLLETPQHRLYLGRFVGCDARYYGDAHRDMFLGPERAARISPLASAAKHGVRWGLHSDAPVTPANPLKSIWTAVTRKTRSSQVLGPEERISAEEALKGYSLYNAELGFGAFTRRSACRTPADLVPTLGTEEKDKGSISVGKLADIAILSGDPVAIGDSDTPDDILGIEVLGTVLGGELLMAGEAAL